MSKEFDNPIPAPNCGTLALNDSLLIVTTPSGVPLLHAFELSENETNPFDSTARMLWSKRTDFIIETRPKTAFEDLLTFYFESQSGHLICIETLTGVEQWRYGTAEDMVSDFVIWDDSYLAFGAKSGNVALIRIGNFPTQALTTTPSIDYHS